MRFARSLRRQKENTHKRHAESEGKAHSQKGWSGPDEESVKRKSESTMEHQQHLSRGIGHHPARSIKGHS